MARKLTEDEKLANKEALQRKRQLHTARRKARDAVLGALTAEHVDPLNAALDQKGAEFNAALKARNEYDERCRAEAAALRQKHLEGRVSFDVAIVRLSTERNVAADARNGMAARILKQVDAQFPDLVGHARGSVAAWTPPDSTADSDLDKSQPT